MGFFDSIKSGFSKAVGAVKGAAGAAFDQGKKIATAVYNPIKKVVGTVYGDAKSAVKWGATTGKDMATQILKVPTELAKNATDFGKSAVSSLAMPLVIGAAVIAGIFLISRSSGGGGVPSYGRGASVSFGTPAGYLSVGR